MLASGLLFSARCCSFYWQWLLFSDHLRALNCLMPNKLFLPTTNRGSLETNPSRTRAISLQTAAVAPERADNRLVLAAN